MNLVVTKVQQVVGMEHAVVTPVRGNAVVNGRHRVAEQTADVLDGQRHFRRQLLGAVDRLAKAARSLAQFFERRESQRRTYRPVTQRWRNIAQRHSGVGEPGDHLGRHLGRAVLVGEQGVKERDVSAQVIECDHRQALTHERVVRIVPFRPLGVHPDAAIDNEVAELR